MIMQCSMPFKKQIGQRLAVGFSGYEVPNELRELIKRHHVGNFILFKDNIKDSTQLQNLCCELQALALEENGIPAFIATDQEGGVVSRLSADATLIPSAMCLAATGDPENAYRAGLLTGRELRAMGVNFNLAPCLDVNSNSSNPVIGVRSYGDTPEQVGVYGARMIQGLLDGGVLCCAKHFPGHGDTSADSHLSLPRIDKTLKDMEACELAPFITAIKNGVPAVMTAHILFPQIEPNPIPATMSKRIITGLLKEKLGFTGLVISDCMMMKAIETFFGTVDGVKAALGAGVDLVLISHSIPIAAQACTAIEDAFTAGQLTSYGMAESVNRILSCKQGLSTIKEELSIVGHPSHRKTACGIMEQGLTLVNAPLGKCPPLGDTPLFLGCAPFQVSIASDPGEKGLSFPHILQGAIGGDAMVTPDDPSVDEVDALVRHASAHSSVVIGTYNGHVHTGQLKLMRALCRLPIPVVCVALRNPYDLLALPDNATGVAVYSYDSLSVAAVVKLLTGELQPAGRLPLSKWRNE